MPFSESHYYLRQLSASCNFSKSRALWGKLADCGLFLPLTIPRLMNTQKKRSFESLEGRQMMAGDVLAFMSSGNLMIVEAVGDYGQAQAVQVSQLADGRISVKGIAAQDGQMSLVNGAAEQIFSVPGNLIVDLAGGNDTLVLGRTGSSVFNDVNIKMSAPNALPTSDRDVVVVERVTTRNHLTIDTGVGNDFVSTWGVIVGDNNGIDNLSFRTGAGSDYHNIYNTTVYGNLTVSAYNYSNEFDIDRVYMQSAYARDNLQAFLGEGDDVLDVYDGYAGNDVYFSTAGGQDTVKLREVRALDDFWASLGDGDDSLDMQYLRADILTLDGGAGYDKLVSSVNGPVNQMVRTGFEWINGRVFYDYYFSQAANPAVKSTAWQSV